MLTKEQQDLVVEAMQLVPLCIKVFKKSFPGIDKVARLCDIESAAYLACCRAARTYDPSKGAGIRTYFSIAIKNGMLREVEKEVSSMSCSMYKLDMGVAEKRMPPPPKETDILLLLRSLPEKHREWIERRLLDGVPYTQLAKEVGGTRGAAKKELMRSLDELKFLYDDWAFC